MCTKLEKLLDRLPTTLTPNDAATRNTDTARTLDGRIPVDRPYVWICARRPTIAGARDDDQYSAINHYYCPECDWNDYYCLCSTLKTVGPNDNRLLALEKRREEETGLVGYTVDRCSAAVRGRRRTGGERDREEASTIESVLQRTTWPDVDDGASTAGRCTLQSTGGRGGVDESRTVAVDEGGDGGSRRCSMEATKSMATAGARDDADGSDAGRSCHRRSRDVLLRVDDVVKADANEDVVDAMFDDDEELELFLKAYDEGQVRICCEWTAAPLASEKRTEAVDEPYRRKVAVWKRPWFDQQDQQNEEQRSSGDDDPMVDDDDEDLTRALDEWERDEEANEEQQQQQEEEQQQAAPETPASPPPPPPSSWKTPRNAILYTTRRWELVPRASKRLEAKEHARWLANMQQSIDDDDAAEDEWRRTSEELGIDEKLAERRRRRTTPQKKGSSSKKKKKMLTPRSKVLATGWERGTARRNLAKIDFK